MLRNNSIWQCSGITYDCAQGSVLVAIRRPLAMPRVESTFVRGKCPAHTTLSSPFEFLFTLNHSYFEIIPFVDFVCFIFFPSVRFKYSKIQGSKCNVDSYFSLFYIFGETLKSNLLYILTLCMLWSNDPIWMCCNKTLFIYGMFWILFRTFNSNAFEFNSSNLIP